MAEKKYKVLKNLDRNKKLYGLDVSTWIANNPNNLLIETRVLVCRLTCGL